MSDPILSNLFETNLYTIRVNTEGITDAEALLQPHPAGNCMNWVVGHILSSREGALKLFGEEPVLPADATARYKRGSGPIAGPGDGLAMSELLARFALSQERLLRGIENLPAAKWEEERADFGTVRRAVYFLHFHEAYHAGQIAVLRRLAGKKGAIQ
ncbi:MAG TPA: DinB family protein [Candidatus Eisenbacteria bacterium]|nr:DinB family protein [Candidatus Eisenbacteria bacterium]